MASNEYAQMEKLLSSKFASAAHTTIKDKDLQIQLPSMHEKNDLEAMSRFKALYTRLEKDRFVNQITDEAPTSNAQMNPKLAMEEAQTTYDLMMEIRKQLDEAYQEFLRMR